MGAGQSGLTQEELESQLADYAKLVDIQNLAKKTELPNTANFALKTELPNTANFALKGDLAPYAKTSDIDTKLSSGFGITGNNNLEFGKGVVGKEPNSGKIVYGGWDRPNHLGIVGGGKPGEIRKVKIWDELEVDNINTANAKINGKTVATVDQIPDLAPYAKNTDLASYAKTSDLAPYAKTSDLASYAIKSVYDSNQTDANINKPNTVLGGNQNSRFLLHVPDDGRKTLWIAPINDSKTGWVWANSASLSDKGTFEVKDLKVNGGITVNGQTLAEFVKGTQVDADTVAASLANNNTFITGVQGTLYNNQKTGINTAVAASLKADADFQKLVKGNPGDKGPAGTMTNNTGFEVTGKNLIELGKGITGKEVSAGKIGYQPFSGGLDIVGAGTQADINANKLNRLVQIYDSLNIKNNESTGGWTTHFNYDGTNVNYIRGNTVFDQGGIQFQKGYGLGPYVIRLMRRDDNRCLDVGQWDNTNKGHFTCNGGAYQQFYYDPVTRQLKNVATGKCLDTNNSSNWNFNDCNSAQRNQQFQITDHGNIYAMYRGKCLDVGDKFPEWNCEQFNASQNVMFSNS
jgi:hypothetical protein